MPDKLTDSEIVKACKNCFNLELCLKNLTNAFPDTSQEEINLVLMREGCCKNFIDKDLINRLQANLDDKEDTIQYADKVIKSLQADMDRLQANISELVKQTKAEAYKEVFQKLKDKSIMCKVKLYGKGKFFPCLSAVTLHDIRLLEKEMVGDDYG